MKLEHLKNVVTLDFNEKKCIGCGICLEVCPHNVFKMESGKVRIQKRNSCMECGACVSNCPAEAFSVRAGVGCANAIFKGKLNESKSYYDDSDNDNSPCCG